VNDEITRKLRFCTSLPSLPAVAIKIIDLANDPNADIGVACQYISLDPALSAKILKLANSPLYKSRRVATNIRQAVSILGTHTMIVVALSFTLANSLMKTPGQYATVFNNETFWLRSIASSLACRALGEKLGLKNLDDLFLAGLLQDIGILAYSAIMPTEYGSVYSSTSDHDLLLKTEREEFGVGHDELGYALLKQWHIPDYIAISCVSSHGQPEPKELEPTLQACVAVSRYLADYFLNPKETGKISILTEAAQSWLNLDSATLTEVIDIMESGLSSVEDLFDITIHDASEIAGILTEAKELLTVQGLAKVRELEEKSQRDGLTGAHNRTYFDDKLQREFFLSKRNNIPLTIAMIDLDHFKNVNDTYGHVVGDAILVAVVCAIFGQIRQDDTLSRYGGEEFTLILPGTTLAASRNLIRRLKDNIAAIAYKLEDNNCVNVTTSIGVAAYMDDATNFQEPKDMIIAADAALYAAKHAGRNEIVEWNVSLQS
jgi:diguanylate cyclase (GGDEF)-like protein